MAQHTRSGSGCGFDVNFFKSVPSIGESKPVQLVAGKSMQPPPSQFGLRKVA